MLEVQILKKTLLNIQATFVIFPQVVIVLQNVSIFFTKEGFTHEFLAFIQTEQRRSNVMTSARIQPFCGKYNINIGCYDGFRVYPRVTTGKKTTLKIYENQFCLIWKSDGISFDRAIKELKDNFRVVDNVICDKHVKILIKYEYEPEKSPVSIN